MGEFVLEVATFSAESLLVVELDTQSALEELYNEASDEPALDNMSLRLLLLDEKLNWPLSVCNLLTNLAFLSGLKNPKLGDFKSLNLLDTSLLAKAASASEYFNWGDRSVYSETGRFVVAFLVLALASENFKGFAKCLPSVVVFMLVELSPEFGSIGKLVLLELAVDS